MVFKKCFFKNNCVIFLPCTLLWFSDWYFPFPTSKTHHPLSFTPNRYTTFTPKSMLSSVDFLVILLHSLKILPPDSWSYSLTQTCHFLFSVTPAPIRSSSLVLYHLQRSSLPLHSPVHSHCLFIATILFIFFFTQLRFCGCLPLKLPWKVPQLLLPFFLCDLSL